MTLRSIPPPPPVAAFTRVTPDPKVNLRLLAHLAMLTVYKLALFKLAKRLGNEQLLDFVDQINQDLANQLGAEFEHAQKLLQHFRLYHAELIESEPDLVELIDMFEALLQRVNALATF